MFNFEKQPEPREKKRVSRADFLDASTLVIVAALVIAIICAFLVQFVFSPEINWRNVGVDTAIICACTISIYILLRSYTLRRGRRTDAWKDAEARVDKNGKQITEKNYARLTADYCRAWEQDRLDEAQNAILSRVGVSLADFKEIYCKYTSKEIRKSKDTALQGLTEAQREAIIRAASVRRMRYNERYLFNDETSNAQRSPSERMRTSTVNMLVNLRTVITSILTCALSASFLQDVIFNFSAEAVVQCIIKLALVAFFGALGMIGGYNFSTVREVREMNMRADEQERFIKWAEGKNNLGANWGQNFQLAQKTAFLGEKTAENGNKQNTFESAEKGSSPFVRTN